MFEDIHVMSSTSQKKMQGKWIYDMDPFEPLKYEQPLQQLKARIAEEGSKAVFSPLIEKFILKNSHRVTVEMQVSRELLPSYCVHRTSFFMAQIYFKFKPSMCSLIQRKHHVMKQLRKKS